MTTTTNLQEDIAQQIQLGFTKQEIEQNLLEKGHDQAEVKSALAHIKITSNSNSEVSSKSILLGVLFVGIAIYRFSRYTSGGNIFLGLGVITGLGMAIYFFTKKS